MRLIDADALIKAIVRKEPFSDCARVVIAECMEEVRHAPTIEPERKNGKWLPDNNNYYEERFICSVCGKSYKVDTCMGKPMWDFCPCGADMREEGEER